MTKLNQYNSNFWRMNMRKKRTNSHLESVFDGGSLASAERVKVRGGPGEKITRLSSYRCFGKLFQDIRERGRDLDLFCAVHGFLGRQGHGAILN